MIMLLATTLAFVYKIKKNIKPWSLVDLNLVPGYYSLTMTTLNQKQIIQ
jgi:hypothetical protein